MLSMRKLIIYTLSFLFAFQFAMAADFTVTGKMKGLTNGSTATLKNVFNGQALATGNITDGAFILKGTVNEGMLLQLSFSAAPQLNIEIFINSKSHLAQKLRFQVLTDHYFFICHAEIN